MSRATGIFLLFLLAFLSDTTPAVADDAPVYRQVIKTFHNDSYYTKGLLATETVADGAGRVFAETAHTYTLRDVDSGNVLTGAAKQSVTATAFPQLTETVKRFLEGGSTSKSTKTTYAYDDLGNVTSFTCHALPALYVMSESRDLSMKHGLLSLG